MRPHTDDDDDKPYVSHRYRALPEDDWVEDALEHLNIHRQLYNHVRWVYDNAPDGEKPSEYALINRLPEWKREWPVFAQLHSRAAQETVSRFYHNLTVLSELKSNGHTVGKLKRKAPRDYKSVTYVQSGFDLDKKRGHDGYAYVRFSKIGWVKIRVHRDLPEHGHVTDVTFKHEPTGEWYVSFCVKLDADELPEQPDTDTLDAEDCVGVDLGVINYAHTSDGLSVGSLDLSEERERLAREQRKLSRMDRGSNNYERQRKGVARIRRRLRRMVEDFQHKLSRSLVDAYDAVFLEDLNVKGLLELPQNARNKQDAAWARFVTFCKYKGKLQGTVVETVPSKNTTLDCASCGSSVWKPLWVREHACPTCGFETDRDWNAALNVLYRGFEQLGVVHSEETPVETGAAVSADGGARASVRVDASTVVETGSPALNEATQSLSRAG
jgi:putative transposase